MKRFFILTAPETAVLTRGSQRMCWLQAEWPAQKMKLGKMDHLLSTIRKDSGLGNRGSVGKWDRGRGEHGAEISPPFISMWVKYPELLATLT